MFSTLSQSGWGDEREREFFSFAFQHISRAKAQALLLLNYPAWWCWLWWRYYSKKGQKTCESLLMEYYVMVMVGCSEHCTELLGENESCDLWCDDVVLSLSVLCAQWDGCNNKLF